MKYLIKASILALVCAFGPSASAQTLLVYYNLNNTTGVASGKTGSFNITGASEVYNSTNKTISIASAGEEADSAVLNLSAFAAQPAAYFGTTVNAYNSAPSGSALQIVGSAYNNVQMVLSLDTTGWADLNLSLAVAANATGATGMTFQVSSDGQNYVTVDAVISLTRDNAFRTISVDLSDYEEVEDKATAYIRFALAGITGSGTTRLDNIQVSGTAIPEPAVAVALPCLLAVFLCVRRRRKSL